MRRFFLAGKVALGAALVLTSAGARLMAADDLPKAETILDKAVEATGGKAAYQKVHTEITSGSMEINGMKGTSTTYKAEPDKTYTEMTFQGIGKIQEGSNGKVAWSNSAIQGPHVKEGDEKEMALLMARFDAAVGWRDLFPKVETAGAENVEGKDCYKVVLTPKVGKPMTQYYDKQSGLMVKMVITVKNAMGEITVESVADDYRKEGGILVPHKLTNKAMGQQFVISIDKVEYNAEIPASRFDLPAEVQALLDKDKK
jgi:outer membrane lipoprotein-sorting protein